LIPERIYSQSLDVCRFYFSIELRKNTEKVMTEDEKTAQIINALFEKIIRIKPAFKQGWPTETEFQMAKREWVNAFKRANITSLERVKRGIERLADAEKSFLPSPGEFIAMCNPTLAEMGWPERAEAFNSAVRKTYDLKYKVDSPAHPAVDAARKMTGALIFGRGDKVSEPIFIKNYEMARDRFLNGEALETMHTPPSIAHYADEDDKPFNRTFGGYEWVKPGIMKQYEGINRQEALEVISKLLKSKPEFKELHEQIKAM
jgi:hypothetical protein